VHQLRNLVGGRLSWPLSSLLASTRWPASGLGAKGLSAAVLAPSGECGWSATGPQPGSALADQPDLLSRTSGGETEGL